MAKQLIGLTVFVSGGSETEAEKAAIKRVLEEINGVLEKTHGVTLRLVGWPDTIRPGVNADPQSEINRQLDFATASFRGWIPQVCESAAVSHDPES